MPTIRITHIYTFAGQECRNNYSYWNAATVPTLATLIAATGGFESDVLPGILGILNTNVVTQAVVGYASNLAVSYENPNASAGSQAGTLADCVAVDNALVVVKIPGVTVNSDGSPYTGNRPVRKGRVFLSGVLKTMMDGNGSVVPSALATPWANFTGALAQVIDGAAAETWTPVIDGFPLSATGSKPARPHVVAPISVVSHSGFSNLHSRQE